jgi:hypothetical protein
MLEEIMELPYPAASLQAGPFANSMMVPEGMGDVEMGPI